MKPIHQAQSVRCDAPSRVQSLRTPPRPARIVNTAVKLGFLSIRAPCRSSLPVIALPPRSGHDTQGARHIQGLLKRVRSQLRLRSRRIVLQAYPAVPDVCARRGESPVRPAQRSLRCLLPNVCFSCRRRARSGRAMKASSRMIRRASRLAASSFSPAPHHSGFVRRRDLARMATLAPARLTQGGAGLYRGAETITLARGGRA